MGNREAVRGKPMRTFSVNWKIDIVAETPEEAAKQALEIHRDPNSTATVFDVYDDQGNCTCVDLLETEENRTDGSAVSRPDLVETHNQAKAHTAKISHWEDDPEYPSDDWKYEVTLGHTRLGYHEWVEHERDVNKEKTLRPNTPKEIN
jgi:hypothetical protein